MWSRTPSPKQEIKRNLKSVLSVSAPNYLKWSLYLTVCVDFVILPEADVLMIHFFMVQVSAMGKMFFLLSAPLFNLCGNPYCKVVEASRFELLSHTMKTVLNVILMSNRWHVCCHYKNWFIQQTLLYIAVWRTDCVVPWLMYSDVLTCAEHRCPWNTRKCHFKL